MIFCNGEMMKIFRLAGIQLTLDESEESLAAKVAGALVYHLKILLRLK
jgi:hypothetical protein